MEQLANYYIGLISGTHPLLWLLIFGLCLANECTALSIPYVLETTWLMAGTLLGDGEISFVVILPLVTAAILGRLAGMSLFYHLVNVGSPWFFRRFPKLKVRLDDLSLTRRFQSRHWTLPLWVALGRLLWLRFPISIILSLSRRYAALAIGVAISAMIFEFTYIGVGATVSDAVDLTPVQLLPYFIVGITLSFGIGLVIRHLWQLWRRKHTTSSA